MKNILKFIFLFFIKIALVTCSNNQKYIANNKIDPVQLLIEKNADSLLLDPKINAVSIGIYKDGKTYTAHFGELDKGKGNTPTDSTIYEIASVTKSFTGSLVAQAVLDKKINLDDDVQQYLNGDFSNLKYQNTSIKVKHLITHTAGLPRFLPDTINSLFNDIDENLPFRIDAVEKMYNKQQFLKDLQSFNLQVIPGTQYGYSNADTELIAHILEIVYQMTYDELLQKYICEKAAMKDTKVNLSTEELRRLANGYGDISNPVPHFANTLWGAGGGIKSTTADLINYMKFQLDDNNQAAKESHRLLFSNNDEQIGYLWPIKSIPEDGTYYLIHGGAYGTQNFLMIVPKYQLGISIITNQSGPETYGNLFNILNGIFDEVKINK